jgi:hypothetical protein
MYRRLRQQVLGAMRPLVLYPSSARRGSLLRVPVPAGVRATATQRGLPSGFGARVMERIIQGQLNGELKFEWRDEGVGCEITVDT